MPFETSDTPDTDILTAVRQQRAESLVRLRDELATTVDSIDAKLAEVASLRSKRNDLKAAIRELTPHKPPVRKRAETEVTA